jgi:hypothetical protein
VLQQVNSTAIPLDDQSHQRDLEQGLLLRWSTPEDVEQLVTMFANVLRSNEDAPPNHFNGHWVRDMMSGRHPHSSAFDFALVEETRTKQIVASAGLFTNDVSYEDIPFTLGRTSIVGTEIPYRNRGLQRAIFDLIHARSTARGHLVQGITGIHYFYRQFGYEYAIDLEASRHIYIAALASVNTPETAVVALRQATETDIPLLIDLYARERACWQIATVLDEQAWRWMLFGSDSAAGNGRTAYVITTAQGVAIGYLLLDRIRRGPSLSIWGMAVKSGVSLAAIAPQALGAVRDLARAVPGYPESVPPLVRLRLEMGPGHALFDALGPYLAPECKYPYAWWMRIPDVPAFIRHVAPVLEQRLANSALSGFTGELTINFYRGGLRLAFGQGKLVVAEEWRPKLWEEGQAGFPPHVVTQLLLGYHSFIDLRHIYKDVWAEGVYRTLLETIFPPRPSYMLPLT